MSTSAEKAIRAAILSIFGNAFMAVLKGVTGVFGNSYALVADAIESTTDVFASLLVLVGLKFSTNPADENHPYGHGRLEPLLTFVVVGFLVVAATLIVVESIEHIRTPHALPEVYTLWVLAGVVIAKELFFRFLMHKGKQLHSSPIQADAWHHRSDAITSGLAFMGISVALLMGEGYENADDWAALFASALIYYNAYQIFKPALAEALDEHLYDEMIEQVREVAATVEGVVGTEKCLVRKTGMFYHIDLHLLVDGKISVREGHDIAHHLKDTLIAAMPEIADILIHVEPA